MQAEGQAIRVRFRKGFLDAMRQADNVAERLVVDSLVTGAGLLSGAALTPGRTRELVDRVVPDSGARDIHVFAASRFSDFVAGGNAVKPLTINIQDDAYVKIGMGWKVAPQPQAPRIAGVNECCTYLQGLVDVLWGEIRAVLHTCERRSLLTMLVLNHEHTQSEVEQWSRTSRAVLSLHLDKEEAAGVAAMRIGSYNGTALASRILIEMAACECPDEGITLGRLDVSRLLGRALLIHGYGTMSEAIRYGGKEPLLRITPFGDVHSDMNFEEKISSPYTLALGVDRFRASAGEYANMLRPAEIASTAKQAFDPRFWDIWVETFGFSVDQGREFLDELDNEAIQRQVLVMHCPLSKLLEMTASKLPAEVVHRILDLLVLPRRAVWAQAPAGFSE